MGSLRVGHDWATSLSLFTFMHWRRKWQPTPVFLPGDSQGRGSLVGCLLWGHTKPDTTEATSQQHSKCFIFVKSVHLISVIMVLPKLGHLQKDIQSKSTWKKKMSCVPQSFGEIWSPSPCYSAELNRRDLPLEKMYFICKKFLQMKMSTKKFVTICK